MSWFVDNLNPKKEKSTDSDTEIVATYSLAASYDADPYAVACVDIDDFEEIEIDIKSFKDGKVDVSTNKPTNVSE